jgi:PAS domain S-box-containing protein
MDDANGAQNNHYEDWHRVDARILGQILAAQNLLFVLPDEKRIAEYFSEAFNEVPGITSSFVCLGNQSVPAGVSFKACGECSILRKKTVRSLVMPLDFTCRLAAQPDMRVIALKTYEHTFGFFIFQTDSTNAFEPYRSFLSNLANYVALSLENRMQKYLLEKSRNEMEDRVKDRTSKLLNTNTLLEEEIAIRKNTEKALQQSEEQFRFLFETMAQGLIIQDAESEILDANNAACEILGLSRDQMLGKTAYDPRWRLIHEDGSPLYPEEMPSNIALRTCSPVVDILIGAYIPEKDIYHWILTSSIPKFKDGDSKPYLTMTTFTNITERKQVEKERQANLHYFESIDKINRAMQSADNLEQMMSNVLDTMLSIFGCDRAFLAVPCDPTMPEFKIFIERTTPLYPGAFARGVTVPMSPAIQNLFYELLNNPAPNEIFIGKGLDPNDVVWKTYEIKSQLAIALHPKVGKPWECGLHQCSYNRVWTQQEKQLFLEISRRIADSLSSLLIYRDLQESEQRYRMVFENSPVSIWEEDFSEVKKLFDNLKKEGITNIENYFNQHPEVVQQCAESIRLVDVNQSALTLHTAETKQELMANLGNTFTPESFDAFRQELICLWNGETEMATDAVVKTLSGDLRDVTVYVSVCPGYEESLSKILVSLVDITERKHAEEALSKSEKEFRALAENSPDVIVRYDRLGHRIYVNPEFERVNHLSAKEAQGKTPIELSTELAPVANVFTEKLMAAMEAGDISKVDLIWTKDGKPMCWYVRIVPEYDANGTVESALTIWSDISERKQVEAVLAKTTDQLNEAQRIAHIGSWELDVVNNKLSWSDEIFRMFEIDPKKFAATYEAFLNAIHPDDRDEVNLAYTNSLKTKMPYSIIHRLLYPDGRIKYAHEECETIFDENDHPIRSLGVVQDITEQRRIEEEIRKLNHELEQRVLDRTAQLEAANKELEAFAYSVSHDLRAPLRHIDGFMEILQSKIAANLDEQGRHYMDIISDSAKHMGTLIDDLLSFSRMGRNEMSKMQVDIEKLVQEVIREFNPETEGRTIKWQISALPVVTGDKAMLRIVFVNLISNALKFTRKTELAEIEIGFTKDKETGTVIFVRDNGVGFDQNYANKLFGVFQRLHRADEFEGTGIGLANVRRIIARHGGRTWAEGKLNQGATFYFSI